MTSTQSNLSLLGLPPCDNLGQVNETLTNLTFALDQFDNLTFGLDLAGDLTCLEHAPRMTDRTFFNAVFLAVMSVLSLIGNVWTIWSIGRNRRRVNSWSAIYTLILHLAVADLLVTVFCIGGEAIWSYTVAWIWGNVGCKLFKFLQVFSLYLSTFVLVLIGVDRFIAVRYPMKGLNRANRCIRLIAVAWALSLILATPQIVIFHVAQGPFIEEFNQCVTHGFYTEPWQEQLYVSFSLFSMFLLPLAILVGTYVATVITISRSERMFKLGLMNNNSYRVNGDLNRRRLMHRAKTKSLRISVVIVAAFVLWWTPYYTMMIIFMFLNPDKHLSEELRSGIFFFGMSNSLVNPLIYGAFHLWPKRERQSSYQRDGSIVQKRNTTSREARLPFLSKNSLSNHSNHSDESPISADSDLLDRRQAISNLAPFQWRHPIGAFRNLFPRLFESFGGKRNAPTFMRK